MKKEELKKARQYQKLKHKPNAFVSVPLSWCVRFDLTPTELMIFCYIQFKTAYDELHAYTGSVKGLCSIVNCTLPTARSALENLCSKGFIDKQETKRSIKSNEREDFADWVCYIALIPFGTASNDLSIESKLETNKARKFTLIQSKVIKA